MSLYTAIPQRRSCRKYDMQPLPTATMDEIQAAIASFTPLTPNCPLGWRITNQAKGLYHVPAPHYLIISGQGAAHEKEHAGFLFQQLALWLDDHDLGCVWLGEAKDAISPQPNDIIAMAFGKTTDNVHRTRDQFKRKPIAEITNAPDDTCMQAVHIAPSGMNTQPWYFSQQGAQMLVYRQKLKPPISLVYKCTEIDMGIALCHFAVACQELGKPFQFTFSTELPAQKGCIPLGIIS